MSNKINMGRVFIVGGDHSIVNDVFMHFFERKREDIIYYNDSQDLDVVLTRVKPSVIVAIGEDALKQFNQSGIGKLSGRVIYYDDTPLVPVKKPESYDTSSPSFIEFVGNLDTANNVSLGLIKKEIENQFVVIDNMIDLYTLIDYIKQTKYVCFDFETSKLKDRGIFDPDFLMVAVSFSFQQGSSYVLLLNHNDSWLNDDNIEEVVKLFSEIMSDRTITKIGHNIKFDMLCMSMLGVSEFKGCFHDTMVMAHLLDENTSNKLKDCVREYYPKFADYESGVKGYDWTKINTEELIRYAAIDTDLTFRLYWAFTDILMEDFELYNHYRNLCAPVTKMLFKMECRGMLVDKEYLLDAIKQTEKELVELEEKMHSYPQVKKYNDYLVEEEFEKLTIEYKNKLKKEKEKTFKSKKAIENQKNRIEEYENKLDKISKGELGIKKRINFRSPEQLIGLLYTDKGFDLEPALDKRGRPVKSTDKDILEYVEDKSGFIQNLLEYRQLEKVLSTYLKGIYERLDNNHRIHPQFLQHGTRTGRLATRNPNTQNIISRTKFKRVEKAVERVKKSFVPPKDYNIVQIDYSQAELRLMGYYAKDETILNAYREGQDLHVLTAASSRGMSIDGYYKQDEKTQKQQRFEAKAVNFGFIYGLSSYGFKEYARTQYGIKISEKQAERYRERFFDTYKKLPEYHKRYIKQAREYGYVRTFFGRKRRILDIYSLQETKRKHAENAAINAPIQGTAGEMTLFGMMLADLALPDVIYTINNVHDSDLFYIHKDNMEYIRSVQNIMENLPLEEYFGEAIDEVKMVTEAEYSEESWGALKPY